MNFRSPMKTKKGKSFRFGPKKDILSRVKVGVFSFHSSNIFAVNVTKISCIDLNGIAKKPLESFLILRSQHVFP